MTKLAIYGLRNWVEYGLKQSKNELGWADFRVTNYAQIERWWEMVMSAYLLVSLTQTHCISLNHNLRSNAMLNPKRAQTRTISGLESGKRVETGAQQFAFSDSALGDLEFASTLVESISDSTLISRIRVFSTDESLPRCPATPHRPTSTFPLPRVTEERYVT